MDKEPSKKMHSGKVAIVTGSTAGIGFAIAKRLGLDGAKVVLSSRKQSNVDKAINDLRTQGVKDVEGTVCHVAKQKDRENLVDFAMKKYGRIDILVNNAGINPHFGHLLDVSEEVWDKLFDTNVKAGFLFSKQVIPIMDKQGTVVTKYDYGYLAGTQCPGCPMKVFTVSIFGGNIVFVSSITGFVPFQGIVAYGVTKTALLGLIKALSVSCGQMNIRVNGVAPGIIKTDFSKALWENEASSKFYQESVPLGRMGTPDDCSGIVSFLCSDQASYITGETVMVTGGISARL